tara:strand:- start:7 stop:579 length:573 start_codon:yes stop_codon:yes gene_type:complete
MVGQEGKEKPFVPVPKEKQKWAMTLLTKYAFAPDAFQIPSNLYNYLQKERRGFSGTKDPNLLSMFLNMQVDLLNHLLHVNVLRRVSNTELYGNSYGVAEMMKDLTNACFSADAGSNVSSMRINLQTEYTRRLISIVHNKGKVKFDHVSVAMAFNNLNKIKKYAAKTSGANDQTKAHRRHLVYIIDKALDT